jgi:hypothetical protein
MEVPVKLGTIAASMRTGSNTDVRGLYQEMKMIVFAGQSDRRSVSDKPACKIRYRAPIKIVVKVKDDADQSLSAQIQ